MLRRSLPPPPSPSPPALAVTPAAAQDLPDLGGAER
jgi:hypothetical protein